MASLFLLFSLLIHNLHITTTSPHITNLKTNINDSETNLTIFDINLKPAEGLPLEAIRRRRSPYPGLYEPHCEVEYKHKKLEVGSDNLNVDQNPSENTKNPTDYSKQSPSKNMKQNYIESMNEEITEYTKEDPTENTKPSPTDYSKHPTENTRQKAMEDINNPLKKNPNSQKKSKNRREKLEPSFEIISGKLIELWIKVFGGPGGRLNKPNATKVNTGPETVAPDGKNIIQQILKEDKVNVPTPAPTPEPPSLENETQFRTRNPGSGGLITAGFKYDTHPDSFISFTVYKDFGKQRTDPAPFVRSIVLDNGEKCHKGQVMAGIGYIDPKNDTEKSTQRLYCAQVKDPLVIKPTCVNVKLREGPRPNITSQDTAAWVNWLVCPKDHFMTKIYWKYDNVTYYYYPYVYSSADCCLISYKS